MASCGSVHTANLSTGIRLPYVEQGDAGGIPVLLLHGPTDSHRSFEPLLAHLPPDLRALAPSQRGHGDADRPPEGFAPEDFAADALAFLDALGIHAAVLAGHSGAAYTAQLVAREHPERVLGLVLIAAPYSLRDHPAAPGLLRTMGALEDPIDPAFVRNWVTGTGSDGLPASLIETCVAECLKVPAHVWRETFAALFASGPPAPAAAPTLLIWGDADELVSRAEQEAYLDARLVVYEGVGHAPHFEAPERVARDMAAFAREL